MYVCVVAQELVKISTSVRTHPWSFWDHMLRLEVGRDSWVSRTPNRHWNILFLEERSHTTHKRVHLEEDLEENTPLGLVLVHSREGEHKRWELAEEHEPQEHRGKERSSLPDLLSWSCSQCQHWYHRQE